MIKISRNKYLYSVLLLFRSKKSENVNFEEEPCNTFVVVALLKTTFQQHYLNTYGIIVVAVYK